MTQPDMTRTELSLPDTDDPQRLRAFVLEALANVVLARHAQALRLAGRTGSPARALVAALDDAAAHWSIETSRGGTIEDYREVALDIWRVGLEQIPGMVSSTIYR